MPYDPSLPVEGTLIDAVQMRSQLQGLHDEITAIPVGPQGPPGPSGPVGVTAAQVDSTDSIPSGNPAAAAVSLSGTVLHFDFDIPVGAEGPPGEVTQSELDTEIANAITSAVTQSAAASSNNSNAVSFFGGSISDPPTSAEVQAIADKLNELINALRR